jgi:hypothetical protein
MQADPRETVQAFYPVPPACTSPLSALLRMSIRSVHTRSRQPFVLSSNPCI